MKNTREVTVTDYTCDCCGDNIPIAKVDGAVLKPIDFVEIKESQSRPGIKHYCLSCTARIFQKVINTRVLYNDELEMEINPIRKEVRDKKNIFYCTNTSSQLWEGKFTQPLDQIIK